MDKLLFFFILLPLVELALLTTLSHYTSLTTTILFIIITGLLGTWLARSQGLSTYRRIQAELAAGRMPRDSMVDGVLILIGGILLITPGVLTDVVGILLMFPPTRRLMRFWLIRWLGQHFKLHTTFSSTSFTSNDNVPDNDVMDTYATESSATESSTTEPTPPALSSNRLDSGEETAGI
jgi:UPF0716 protein FxsA